jgi:hypothetical protein
LFFCTGQVVVFQPISEVLSPPVRYIIPCSPSRPSLGESYTVICNSFFDLSNPFLASLGRLRAMPAYSRLTPSISLGLLACRSSLMSPSSSSSSENPAKHSLRIASTARVTKRFRTYAITRSTLQSGPSSSAWLSACSFNFVSFHFFSIIVK